MNLVNTDLTLVPPPSGTASHAPAAPRQRVLEWSGDDAAPVRLTLAEAAEMINRALADAAREVRFSVDESSGRAIVRVVHPETGEVLRQIPSETVLAMAAMLQGGTRPVSLGVEFRI